MVDMKDLIMSMVYLLLPYKEGLMKETR